MGRLAAAQCRALLACLAASAIGARAVATECVESPGRVLRACVSGDADGVPTSSPDHLTILPFTRMLSEPMDFTSGIFDVTFGHAQINERVQSTIATQLAEYVVLYSPIQMAADLPENYRARPDAFRFIEDVPTDWETSRTLDAVIGEYVVVARLERGGHDWYLGAITNGTARSLDYRTNPESLAIESRIVGRDDRLQLALAPGGGQAVRFRRLAG